MARRKPKSNTERGRASRLRSRRAAGVVLSARDASFLRQYDRSVVKARAARRKSAAAKRRRERRGPPGSARTAAESLVAALARWMPGPEHGADIDSRWARPPKPGRPGVAVARAEVHATEIGGIDPSSPEAMEIEAPEFPESYGRRANVRARIVTEGESVGSWISLGALSANWQNLAIDVRNKFLDYVRSYDIHTLEAWDSYVTPP